MQSNRLLRWMRDFLFFCRYERKTCFGIRAGLFCCCRGIAGGYRLQDRWALMRCRSHACILLMVTYALFGSSRQRLSGRMRQPVR